MLTYVAIALIRYSIMHCIVHTHAWMHLNASSRTRNASIYGQIHTRSLHYAQNYPKRAKSPNQQFRNGHPSVPCPSNPTPFGLGRGGGGFFQKIKLWVWIFRKIMWPFWRLPPDTFLEMWEDKVAWSKKFLKSYCCSSCLFATNLCTCIIWSYGLSIDLNWE